MSDATTQARPSRTSAQIQADIRVTRLRLAGTVDELTARARPQAIVKSQVATAKAKFADATTTADGDLRLERVAAIGAAALAVVVLVVLRSRHR